MQNTLTPEQSLALGWTKPTQFVWKRNEMVGLTWSPWKLYEASPYDKCTTEFGVQVIPAPTLMELMGDAGRMLMDSVYEAAMADREGK